MATKQSVQMWDNRKLCVLEGEEIYLYNAPPDFTFIICAESPGLFSVVCVPCGLRVCYGCDPVTAIKKANDIFTQYAKDGKLSDYMYYTAQAYRAYLAYVQARAGMYAHSPVQILSQPRFPLFNHHRLEDI